MSIRIVFATLVLLLGSSSSSAESRAPIRRDAREVATLIARAHLGVAASEDPADRQLRTELVMVQELLRRALTDVARGEDSGALATLGAECDRLRPEVAHRALAPSGPARESWARIGAALTELCGLQGQIAASTEPSSRRARSEALLERMDRAYDPLRARETPTIQFPNAEPR
jgi:hypothetical protein